MRYKVGWLMPGHILALTHFEPVVSAEDFTGIASASQAALAQVQQPFHILIDNRIIVDASPVALETMLRALPGLNHPQLRSIVVVLPERMKDVAGGMAIEQSGQIQLKHVDSVEAALHYLGAIDEGVRLGEVERAFFSPDSP